MWRNDPAETDVQGLIVATVCPAGRHLTGETAAGSGTGVGLNAGMRSDTATNKEP